MKTTVIFSLLSTIFISSINSDEIGSDFIFKNVPILGKEHGTVSVVDFTDTTVNLKWDIVYNRTFQYLIVHNINKKTSKFLKKFVARRKLSNTIEYRVKELEPGYIYKFEVLCLKADDLTEYDLDFERHVSKEVITENPKEKPNDLQKLRVFDVTNNAVTLQWSKNIKSPTTLTYFIKYKEVGSIIKKTIEFYSNSEYPLYKITGLKEGKKYQFRVYSQNNKGRSNVLMMKKLVHKIP
ncbi:titin-like [Leptopilina heterotoma]|uniref:titin-like n=1 Tax=Leptopilina heterotoma TaxID=63436 RepID=UPI001CA7C07C|nr:titin-like [Leptopilina heterotoma]